MIGLEHFTATTCSIGTTDANWVVVRQSMSGVLLVKSVYKLHYSKIFSLGSARAGQFQIRNESQKRSPANYAGA